MASNRFDSSVLPAGRHRTAFSGTLHAILRSKNANSGKGAFDFSMKVIDVAVRRLHLSM
jgi:hypothetical protein